MVKTFPKIAAALLLAPAFGGGAGYAPRRTDPGFPGKWQVVAAGHRVHPGGEESASESGCRARCGLNGGSQQTITYSISNHSYASSEEKARREFDAYKISVYVRGDTAWVVGEWQGSRPRRSSSEFVINVPRNTRSCESRDRRRRTRCHRDCGPSWKRKRRRNHSAR